MSPPAPSPSDLPLTLAILDDYHNISLPHFSHIPALQLSVTSFPDTINPTTESAKKELISRLHPFHLLSTMRERTPFPREILQALPNLKVIFATGKQFSSFDLAAAKELGIRVCAAPGAGRTDGKGSGRSARVAMDIKKGGGHPTTQHVWALVLGLARNVACDDAVVKGKVKPGKSGGGGNVIGNGGWQTEMAIGLQGKTLGIVGLGRIGALVARVGVLAWGMRVVCWSENLTQEKADAMAEEVGLSVFVDGDDGERTFEVVGKEELFRTADVVSLHYVLSERSRGIVGEKQLGWMKESALFVNTSRGPLVDERALLDILRKGSIRGAALDVFDLEPLPADSLWRTEDWDEQGKSRVLLTPHMGYVEEGTLRTWYEETAENVERYLDGRGLLHVII